MPARDVKRNIGFANPWLLEAQAKIVPIHRGVEDTHGYVQPLDTPNFLAKAPCNVHPSLMQPDQSHAGIPAGSRIEMLQDLPGHAFQRTVQIPLIH